MSQPSLLHQILSRWQEAYDQGQPLSAEELCRDCPELLPEVQQHIEALLSSADAGTPDNVSTGPYLPEADADRPTPYLPTETTSAQPTQAGRYHIQEEIAHGGMGAVLRAFDPDIGRTLAVKIMLSKVQSDPDARNRFWQEARITGQLQHPGIPPIHELGTLANGCPFFAMKLIEGRTLGQLLKKRGNPAQDLPRFVGIFGQICQTLAYAHSQGILHRDLKPHNIMVGAFGEVQVMDWGLAKKIKEKGNREQGTGNREELFSFPEGTQVGVAMGTPAYMAPEQARGEVVELDERADVFGLGAILCQLLTAKPPYIGTDGSRVFELALRGDLTDAYTRLDSCSADAELIRLCKQCLQPNKIDRPRDAGAVADAVAAYQTGVEEKLRHAELLRAQAEVQAEEERKRRHVERQRSRLGLALAAALLLMIGGGSVAALWYQWDLAIRHEQEVIRQTRARDEKHQREQAIEKSFQQFAHSRNKLHDSLRHKRTWRTYFDTPAKWRAELTTLRAALNTAKTIMAKSKYNLDAKLQTRLRQLEKQFADDEQDHQLALALEHARLERTTIIEGKWNNAAALIKYPALLEPRGLNPQTNSPQRIADHIRKSPIREQLIAILDDWALVKWIEENVLPQRWLETARRADPGKIRDEIRSAHVWRGQRELYQLVKELQHDKTVLRELSPHLLNVVGALLPARSRESIAWYRTAQVLYPHDFWLNLHAGVMVRKSDAKAAVGFHRAALAIRPGSTAAWTNLASALSDASDPHGAVLACRNAIELDENNALAYAVLGSTLREQLDDNSGIAHLQKAVTLDPKLSVAWYNLGNAHTANKNFHEAIQAYHKAIKTYRKARAPDDTYSKAHSNLGAVLHTVNNLPAAAKACRKAIELDPTNPKAHFNLGSIFADQKDWRQASVCFRKAVDLDPKYVKALTNLSLTLAKQNDFAGSMETAKKALALDPKCTDAHIELGIVLDLKKDHDAAIASYHKALECDPKSTRAYHNLGLAFASKKDFADAVTAFQKAIECDATNAESYHGLGLALTDQKNYAAAEKPLRKAAEFMPKNAHVFNALGNLYRQKKDFPKAITAYRTAVALDAQLAKTWFNLGHVLRDNKDMPGAIVAYRKTVALEPNNVIAHNALGTALFQQKDFPGAITAYRKAVAADPKFALAWYQLGSTLHTLKDLSGAVAAYKKAIALDGKDAGPHFNLGMALAALDDRKNAIAAFRKAATLDAGDPRIWLNLGLALRKQNQLAEAIAAYNKAIRLDPKSVRAHGALGQALLDQGEFAKAMTATRRVLELVAPQHPHYRMAQRQLRQCQQLQALEKRLPAVLKGKEISAAETLAMANLCRRYLRRYEEAVQLYKAAFTVSPKLADDMQKRHRYNAAGVAVLAAKKKEADKSKLQQQALHWLEADLQAWTKLLKAQPLSAPLIHEHLQTAKEDPNLASVREEAKPQAASKPWQKLWSDIESLRKNARAHYTETLLRGVLTNAKREHRHELNMTAGKTHILLMQSQHFDTFLKLQDTNGNLLAENDDIDYQRGNLNSRIVFQPKRDGTYIVVATSYQQRGRGAYEIVVRAFRDRGKTKLPTK